MCLTCGKYLCRPHFLSAQHILICFALKRKSTTTQYLRYVKVVKVYSDELKSTLSRPTASSFGFKLISVCVPMLQQLANTAHQNISTSISNVYLFRERTLRNVNKCKLHFEGNLMADNVFSSDINLFSPFDR